MIRVTQGHEKGIGLETFLKAFLCLPKRHQHKLVFYCSKSALLSTLNNLRIPFSVQSDQIEILGNCLSWVPTGEEPTATSASLHRAIDDLNANDILLTLPSSKDQIKTSSGDGSRGHTDLFRALYPGHDIVMGFLSPELNALLLTDHIALGEVEEVVDEDLLQRLVAGALDSLVSIRKIQRVYIAGINPHCGEGGIISSGDELLVGGIEKLAKIFPDIEFFGPLPGDTILFNPIQKDSLFVFPYHDQGLAPFKLFNGLTGINITLGLPFRRVSVDHGTAFDLYGKNLASYQGMQYLLNEILSW